MATTANPPPGALVIEDQNGSDPFVSNPHDAHRQRYSAFDNSNFSLYLNGSPAQAKRALQAHLTETTRRLQETSHLGNSLVQQRKELEEKLKEVEKQEADTDIGPELRQRLAELEKEFNHVGRETARAFLPKSRVPSGETDATAGASVYSSEAHHSPSKVSVPSRKQRNQQPSRINDIQLATDISTSLLDQLKNLQAVLSEKDEALKAADLDRSTLQFEMDGLQNRLRVLDESETRLKDVNWNLESQVRDFEASTKAAADKEQRQAHNLNLANSEKAQLQLKFEELKHQLAKLQDDQTWKMKQHESELSSMRRNVSMGESERGALQRKVDELANQNTELAKAVAYRMRGEEGMSAEDTSPDDGAEEGDTITPDHSPPPSPSKATPRHGQLESETLKHSLHHAHRMIQQLKNNIHREKTEKIELKRMLQDARDELDTNRHSINGPGSAGKRRKNDKDVFKKPARPDRLGALRTGSQEVMVDDEDWEEQDGAQQTPSKRPKQIDAVPGAFPSGFSSANETSTEGFETANETSDAFETANERDGTATETDAFQTGAETLDGDSSDDLTETEGGPSGASVRAARPSPLSIAGNRKSFQSTASTSGDEDDGQDARTPQQAQHPRYRLKLRQGGYRRSRSGQEMFANTPPAATDSPASFASNNSTPAQGKSLFAELGNLSGESEDGSVADGTPSRSSLLSPDSSPEVLRTSVTGRTPLHAAFEPKPVMVDSGMMTEPWSPTTTDSLAEDVTLPATSTAHVGVSTEPQIPDLAFSSLSTQFVQPEAPVPKIAPTLQISTMSSQNTVPQSPTRQSLRVSSVSAQHTAPISPVIPKVVPPMLKLSSIGHHSTEPIHPPPVKEIPQPSLVLSSLASQATEPVEPIRSTMPIVEVPSESQGDVPIEEPNQVPLDLSSLSSQHTSPIAPTKPAPSQLSIHSFQTTEPSESRKPQLSQLSNIASQYTDPIEPPKRTPSQVSVITVQQTEPVQPLPVPGPQHRVSDVMVLQDTQPESPTLPSFLPSPSRPSTSHHLPEITLSLSDIMSQETEPQLPSRPVTAHRVAPVVMSTSTSAVQTDNQKDEQPETTKFGFFSSVLPWGKNAHDTADSASEPAVNTNERKPLAPVASNAVQKTRSSSPEKSRHIPTATTGTQTLVSADQIDKLLAAKLQRLSGSVAAASVEKHISPPSSPRRLSIDPHKVPRRPGSSGSIRSRAASPPPLPADHKEVIAAAALKSPQPAPATPGSMGPPLLPASAYKTKRPQTPTIKTNVATTPKTGGTTPRPRFPTHVSNRSGASSPMTMTRRSSVSSFASDIEQRFNIGANPFTQATMEGITDPRMIQAITQTMIGESLWKYTRKAGRETTSENRHRRFFWVHPYTRTLYWSEQDPSTAGRAQSKAKSVAIESVTVVDDDNPFPPGLHRKSMIVTTPGRTIKFTAPTQQRHDTWFNALTYLLMRSTGDEPDAKSEAPDDIQSEFNGNFRSSSRQTGRSRMSVASHVSRRTSSPYQQPTLQQRTSTQPQVATVNSKQPGMSGRLSSLGSMFNRTSSGLRDSYASRHSGATGHEASSMEQSSTSNDAQSQSAEELAGRIVEYFDRNPDAEMENVRACCDGKHDVGHLHHHHHSTKNRQRDSTRSRASFAGSIRSMTSRSHSRASARRDDERIQSVNEMEAENHGAGG